MTNEKFLEETRGLAETMEKNQIIGFFHFINRHKGNVRCVNSCVGMLQLRDMERNVFIILDHYQKASEDAKKLIEECLDSILMACVTDKIINGRKEND